MDRPTILVIDYEPRNLAATVEPLTAAGYQVEVARDGIAGLEAFRRLQPPVVFMEAMLPKKHAFEVCQEIRRAQSGRKTRVFILGAPTIAQSQQLKAVHQYGADRFLPRPVDGQTLVSLCSPILPGPDAPQVPELDLLEPIASEQAAAAESEILAALDAPPASVERLDLSSMTEDDIMAQLDQLLPSVGKTPSASAPLPPAPPVAAKPAAAPKPVRPRPTPAPKTPVPPRAAAPAPVLVTPPLPDLRPAPSAEAAPTPPPTRSRLPMVLAGCVLASAAFGSWMLFRPGAAPVVESVPAPFVEEAPLERVEAAPPPATTAPAPAEVVHAPADPVPSLPVTAVAPPPKASPAPAASVPPRVETTRAQKTAPPPAPPQLAKAPTPQPVAQQPPAPTPASASVQVGKQAAAPTETASEIPLPLAPPRLEPLPVGSDAARPRISPDVFLRRTQEGSLVELREVDEAPVPVSRPAPVYPAAARQMRRQGEVQMRLLIDAQGQVAAVELLTGGKSDLGAAAERAARQWKYRPAVKDGVPVQVKIVEKVAFKL